MRNKRENFKLSYYLFLFGIDLMYNWQPNGANYKKCFELLMNLNNLWIVIKLIWEFSACKDAVHNTIGTEKKKMYGEEWFTMEFCFLQYKNYLLRYVKVLFLFNSELNGVWTETI